MANENTKRQLMEPHAARNRMKLIRTNWADTNLLSRINVIRIMTVGSFFCV